MALDALQRALVRTEVGTTVPPSDDDLDEIHDRRGGLVGVIREVWTGRLANMLAAPATFAIPGDYSQSTSTNIVELRKLLKLMAHLPDDSDDLSALTGSVTVRHLVRCDPVR